MEDELGKVHVDEKELRRLIDSLREISLRVHAITDLRQLEELAVEVRRLDAEVGRIHRSLEPPHPTPPPTTTR